MRTLAKAAAALALAAAAGCARGDNVPPGVRETRGRLPAGFPADLPLPPRSKVIVSADLTGGVNLVLFRAPTPPQGFRTFFLTELQKAGWALATCVAQPQSPEPVTQIVAIKGRTQANVNAGYLKVNYPIRYHGSYSFAIQYWRTPQPAATPSAPAESCR